MADIFISYRSLRRPAIEHLSRALEAHGYSVWFDYALLSGVQFEPIIQRELRAAKAVIVVWCGLSIDPNSWVREEAGLAKDLGTIIPVWLEQVDLPLGFRGLDTIDLSEWDGNPRGRGLDRLIDQVAKRVNKKPTPAYEQLVTLERTWLNYGQPKWRTLPLDEEVAARIEVERNQRRQDAFSSRIVQTDSDATTTADDKQRATYSRANIAAAAMQQEGMPSGSLVDDDPGDRPTNAAMIAGDLDSAIKIGRTLEAPDQGDPSPLNTETTTLGKPLGQLGIQHFAQRKYLGLTLLLGTLVVGVAWFGLNAWNSGKDIDPIPEPASTEMQQQANNGSIAPVAAAPLTNSLQAAAKALEGAWRDQEDGIGNCSRPMKITSNGQTIERSMMDNVKVLRIIDVANGWVILDNGSAYRIQAGTPRKLEIRAKSGEVSVQIACP